MHTAKALRCELLWLSDVLKRLRFAGIVALVRHDWQGNDTVVAYYDLVRGVWCWSVLLHYALTAYQVSAVALAQRMNSYADGWFGSIGVINRESKIVAIKVWFFGCWMRFDKILHEGLKKTIAWTRFTWLAIEKHHATLRKHLNTFAFTHPALPDYRLRRQTMRHKQSSRWPWRACQSVSVNVFLESCLRCDCHKTVGWGERQLKNKLGGNNLWENKNRTCLFAKPLKDREPVYRSLRSAF